MKDQNKKPVGVLAVMDAAQKRWALVHETGNAEAMREARAAVAELTAAAAGGFGDLLAMVDAADRREVWTVNAGTRLRLERLAAALARIG
jgi:hypothetical protein